MTYSKKMASFIYFEHCFVAFVLMLLWYSNKMLHYLERWKHNTTYPLVWLSQCGFRLYATPRHFWQSASPSKHPQCHLMPFAFSRYRQLVSGAHNPGSPQWVAGAARNGFREIFAASSSGKASVCFQAYPRVFSGVLVVCYQDRSWCPGVPAISIWEITPTNSRESPERSFGINNITLLVYW